MTKGIFHRFIDHGEFGEVYRGSAVDILGPETGPTPVAVKVRTVYLLPRVDQDKSVELHASVPV